MSENEGPPANRPRIKPVSRITQSKFSKLKNARCFPEIDRRLRLGWSPLDLAHAIHEEFDEFKDTSIKYLRKLIERYRSQIPSAELSLHSANSLISRKATKALNEGLDELAEIESLVRRQLARIAIDESNEQKIGKLLPDTGNEIIIAAKLLKQSTDLKMDLGLVKRQMGSVELTGQVAAEITDRHQNDVVGKMIADPNTRKRIISIADKLLTMGAKAGIDAAAVMSNIPKPDVMEAQIIDVDPGDDDNNENP